VDWARCGLPRIDRRRDGSLARLAAHTFAVNGIGSAQSGWLIALRCVALLMALDVIAYLQFHLVHSRYAQVFLVLLGVTAVSFIGILAVYRRVLVTRRSYE
jgi:hypothetical protein